MKRLLIIFCMAGLTACAGGNTADDPRTDNHPETTAIAEPTFAEEVFETLDGISGSTEIPAETTFNGTMVMPPQSQATVSLSMDGIVRNTSLLPGAYVRKGTVLATVENPEFIELQETYLDAAAQLEFLEAEYNRQQVLAKEEAASQKRLEQSKADYLSMKSRMDGAAARLSLLGIPAEQLRTGGIVPFLEVKAPISGYLSNVQMNVGKHISAGEPLCEIIDKSKMLVKLTAYEKDLSAINIGDAVEFRVNGLDRDRFTGKIISVGHLVDDASRSIEIYASVDDKHAIFRPGMYVNARITNK